MIEHDDVREALELAAVEPGGLDRLAAGDTADAAVVAGHLAGCPACLEELARLRRVAGVLRPVLAEVPDPALRDRTLAFVRDVGVARGQGLRPSSLRAEPAPRVGEPVVLARGAPRRAPLGWVAALAAALVIGVLGGAFLVNGAAPAGTADPAVALDQVTRQTATLLAAGDARTVVLAGAGGTSGTMVLSPSAGRMVASATGLGAPPRGSEYRCWVEVGGSRRVLGTMWWAGGVAWWAGEVALPAELPPGVVYGVSLVDASAAPGPGTVVLTGAL